jgi:hypothetical protein
VLMVNLDRPYVTLLLSPQQESQTLLPGYGLGFGGKNLGVSCFSITYVDRLLLGTLPVLKTSWETEARKHREDYYVRTTHTI